MPSSDATRHAAAVTFTTADLMTAILSGRSILLSAYLTDDSAVGVVTQLTNFAKMDLSPVAILIGGNSGDYIGMMLVIDHVRLSPLPVLGVAISSIGAISAALLQSCSWRFARSETDFNVQLVSSWLEASVTLHGGLSQAEARDSLLRNAARMRMRLDAVTAILASRSTIPASEWATRIKEGRGLSLAEGMRVGLIDAIID